jgi:opacity protein-like surface antigen
MNTIQRTLQKSIFSFLLLFSAMQLHAQGGWEAGLNAGAALPITGYKGVFKTGWLLGAQGKYRFSNGNFAIAMQTDFVRLQKDKNPKDTFQNARMTLAPILFMAEYELKTHSAWKPYIAGGLGISLFNFTYHISPTEGRADFNVSFSLAPQLGVRYEASPHLLPFLETRLVLLADGPPIGFPNADKMTGYTAIAAGVNYRF